MSRGTVFASIMAVVLAGNLALAIRHTLQPNWLEAGLNWTVATLALCALAIVWVRRKSPTAVVDDKD